MAKDGGGGGGGEKKREKKMKKKNDGHKHIAFQKDSLSPVQLYSHANYTIFFLRGHFQLSLL